jgi:hypothetical protein
MASSILGQARFQGLPSMSMGIARKHEGKVKPVSVGGIAHYCGKVRHIPERELEFTDTPPE